MMNQKRINGLIATLACNGLWVTTDVRGNSDVHNDNGSWLGWTNAEGAVQSMSTPDRSGESAVYSAVQSVKHGGG